MSTIPAWKRLTAEQQFEILVTHTEEVLPEGELLERLRVASREGRPLRVKQGFDPTAPDIHLGHTVGLRKLRQFQELGHQVVLIVGDYTGMVGDPSGRSKTRPQLSAADVEAHAATYLDQFHRVVPRDVASPLLPVEVHRNGEWFAKMAFMDIMHLASQYTVARMLERDDFSQRFAKHQPISIHELFYPLMQGYDSVAIRADVELGATEQKFNLLVGRTLQELHGQRPQVVMTLPVLPGLDGVQRMSKSLGNYIGVTESPREMFGKAMSLPDGAMPLFWRLVAEVRDDEREGLASALAALGAGEADTAIHPMELKKRLGHRLVEMYHGRSEADAARAEFELQFQKRGVPEHLPVVDLECNELGIKDLLVQAGLAASGSAAWRAVDQGAVSVDGAKVTDRALRVSLVPGIVLRLGRKMVRVQGR